MTHAIDFTKQYDFAVEVFDDEFGDLGSGTLHFGPGRWTHIEFDLMAPFRVLPEGSLPRPLKAQTSDGARFTLFDCKRFDFSVGVSFVVAGDTTDRFKRIEIRYSDISEWFLPWQRLDGTVGESVTWTRPVRHLATTIAVKREKFALTTKSESSITRSGEDHILHEHVVFCFEHLSGHFALEAIRTKVFELSNLLSILIAYPLSVISVQVAGKNGAAHHAFFSTFKPVERDPSDNHFPWRCFIQQPSIHDRWETILNRYFNSAYRKISWTRLAGMQRYEGFWEYRALGYVSLLDQYVDQRHREARSDKKIPVSVGAEAKTKLDAALKSLSPPLPESQRAAIIGIIGDIFSHKRELEFGEKYRRAISTANQDIVKIIGISDADFNLIKRVRNNIAHGKAIDLPDASLQRIDTVVSKLVLLMTYWAFLDVGLTNDDFFRCLRTTHHPLRFSAEMNIAHLDRMTNPESFFSVSKAQFDRISRVKGIRANACFSLSKSGVIRYSKKYSTAYHNWMTSHPTGFGMTTHADLFGVPQERVSYLTPLYIECGYELLRLETAFVIRNA